MDQLSTVIWLAVGAGCIWHGVQIVWVAPWPQSNNGGAKPEPGSAEAFQVFWLAQYAWIGISLVLVGIAVCLLGLLS